MAEEQGAPAQETGSEAQVPSPEVAAQSIAPQPTPEEPQAHAAALTDDIHMPPNSYWPLAASLTLAIAMLGIVTLSQAPFVLIIGLIGLVISVGGWVRDARKEFSELH